MNGYTLKACETLMNNFLSIKDGAVYTLEEGVLGLGLVVCEAEGKKTAVIKERYVNAWTSTHTIRLYNKTPKKFEKMILNKF